MQLDDEGVVAAAGDHRLLSAWAELGMLTFDPNAEPGVAHDAAEASRRRVRSHESGGFGDDRE